jgi:hypothetical protein
VSPGLYSVLADDPSGDVTAVRWAIPELSRQRAWDVLCRAFASGSRSGESTKLFADGQRVDRAESYPGPAARTPEDWLTAQRFGDVFAYARDVQRGDPDLFRALVSALEPWFAGRGLPGGPVEAEIFLGRYAGTPGGVHRERCTNLHLVVDGTKSMHFWTAPQWPPPGAIRRADTAPGHGAAEEYLPGLDPLGHLDQARSLRAGAGGGFAWPAWTWHTASSPAGLSISLNVAAYDGATARPRRTARSWSRRFLGQVPPAWLAEYEGRALSDVNVPPALARLSALGMAAPATADRAFPSNRCSPPPASVRRAAPILWLSAAGVLTVAALGRATRIRHTAGLSTWLSRLTASGASAEIPAECWSLANSLLRWGAVTADGVSA